MAKGGYRPGSGRKPGYKAKVAELYSDLLAKEVEKDMLPLVQALVGKAKTGDIPAFKEIHERIMGKVPQKLTDDEGNAVLPFQIIIKQQDGESRN